MNDIQRWERWGVAGLSLCFIFLTVASAWNESPTVDEPTHVTSGYAYWDTGRYFLDPVSPPLGRLWLAAPLRALSLKPFYPPPHWVIERRWPLSDWLLTGNTLSRHTLVLYARGMVIILGIGLGVLIWVWTRTVFGAESGMAALFLYTFCPTLLSYSHLATLDFPSAAASVLALYLLWRVSHHPTWAAAALAGAGMGINLGTKWTGILLAPALLVNSIVGHVRWAPYAGVVYLGACLGIFGIIYKTQAIPSLFAGYLDLQSVMHHASQWFAGRWNDVAVWPWFLSACFFLKIPLQHLVLMSSSFLPGVLSGSARRFALQWLAFPALSYLVLASFSNSQFGVRRILFVFVLACIAAGSAVGAIWKKSRVAQISLCVLACLLTAEVTALFPRYLSYFSPMVGGPSQGHRYLLDCNLDWGQGLKALGDYVRREKIDGLYLCYFGGGAPKDYAIRYVLIDLDHPPSAYLRDSQDPRLDLRLAPRVYLAISATALMGGNSGGKDPWAWLRKLPPAACLMDSIWVYDLTRQPEARRWLEAHAKHQHIDLL